MPRFVQNGARQVAAMVLYKATCELSYAGVSFSMQAKQLGRQPFVITFQELPDKWPTVRRSASAWLVGEPRWHANGCSCCRDAWSMLSASRQPPGCILEVNVAKLPASCMRHCAGQHAHLAQLVCSRKACVQRQHGLHSDVEAGDIEGLKHDLCSVLPAGANP